MIYIFRFLPVTSETDDESCSEFAVRVQQLIASDLKIEATSFTSADKAELVKRIIADQAQAASSPTNSGQIDEMTSMARLVQAVLPHVPIQNIKDDLGMNMAHLGVIYYQSFYHLFSFTKADLELFLKMKKPVDIQLCTMEIHFVI